jgi:nucleotide-binding universal stress UspA family protein
MTKQNTNHKNKIVWAIDPFETRNAKRAPLAKFLKIFSQKLSLNIAPFALISPGGLAWPVPVSYEIGKKMKAFGEKVLKKDLEKLKIKNALPPTVEVHESSSRRELVGAVVKFAKEQDAAFIAVNAKSESSKIPFKLGGFAEALVAQSPVPVLAVNPKANVPSSVKSILFPTDFSKQSNKAFQETVSLAKKLGAGIQLLHVQSVPQSSYAEIGLGTAFPFLVDALGSGPKSFPVEEKAWVKRAAEEGVPCEFHYAKIYDTIAFAVLKFAKKNKSDLIVLGSTQSANFPNLLGGTVRTILGASSIPVIEIHTS